MTRAETPAEHLARRMRRVLVECRKVEREAAGGRAGPSAAVHDLRVALRRCRSIARAIAEIDPDPRWRRMRRAGRTLARRVGDVRDADVMRGWLAKLAPAADPVRRAMRIALDARDAGLARAARTAVERFDRRRWARLRRELAARLRALELDDLVYEQLALERYGEARALHARAMRSPSAIAWHRLRIGLKRFRYVVEGLLPASSRAWAPDLKRIQDCLGDAHDLHVLADALVRHRPALAETELARWRARIDAERRARLEEYRRLARGRQSVWVAWRARLPSGERLARAERAKLEAWASCRDPRFRRTRRVTRRALALFDARPAAHARRASGRAAARRILEYAALTHDVGRLRGRRRHHKVSGRMIRDLTPPEGWTGREMELVALVARYHRGAPPQRRHRAFAALGRHDQAMVRDLARIVRRALALERGGAGRVIARAS